MKSSTNLSTHIINHVIISKISFECSWVDFRNRSGDMELEFWDGETSVFLNISTDNVENDEYGINSGHIYFMDEEFKVTDFSGVELPKESKNEILRMYEEERNVPKEPFSGPIQINNYSDIQLCQ